MVSEHTPIVGRNPYDRKAIGKKLFFNFPIYHLVYTLLDSFLSLLQFTKIVIDPIIESAQSDETLPYEDGDDEEEVGANVDLMKSSTDEN